MTIRQTQSGNLTTNHKVKIDFTSPEFSATKVVVRNCCVNDSAKIWYNIILGRYLLTILVLYLKFSNGVIKVGDGPFEMFAAPMVNLGMYEFKTLRIRKITPKEYSQMYT